MTHTGGAFADQVDASSDDDDEMPRLEDDRSSRMQVIGRTDTVVRMVRMVSIAHV